MILEEARTLLTDFAPQATRSNLGKLQFLREELRMNVKTILIASSIVSLLVSCGSSGGDGGPAPQNPPEKTDQSTPNQGSGQKPASEAVPTLKPVGELKVASLDELMAIIVPNFSAQSIQISELYDRLVEFSSKASETFDSEFVWRPSSLDDSPNLSPSLVEGAECNAIHSGPSNSKRIGYLFDISDAAKKLRYGVEEVVTENFNRKLNADNPSYSIISFSETTIAADTFWGVMDQRDEFYVGASNDWIVLGKKELRKGATSTENSWEHDSLESCALAFNRVTMIIKRACSSASWTERASHILTQSEVTEVFQENAFSYTSKQSTDINSFNIVASEVFTQKTALSATFEQIFDVFRFGKPAESNGFGFFFPYSYAKGDVSYGKSEPNGRIDQCKVGQVLVKKN